MNTCSGSILVSVKFNLIFFTFFRVTGSILVSVNFNLIFFHIFQTFTGSILVLVKFNLIFLFFYFFQTFTESIRVSVKFNLIFFTFFRHLLGVYLCQSILTKCLTFTDSTWLRSMRDNLLEIYHRKS